jgi:tetratricopeptide (TPR) repeat protein
MCYLNKITLFTLLLGFFISFGQAFGGEVSMDSPEVEQIIFRGVKLVHQDSTFAAVEEFKKLIDLFPQDPIGYFYVSASLQTMMDDYRNYSYLDEFNKYMNQAIKTGEERKKKGNLTAYDCLYLGGAIGYRGIHKGLTGDWVGAFVDGLKGKGYLEKALEIDSTLYDVYYGLGTYHFWKSLKAKIFWWLPFVADNRQKGINMIKLAIEKGKYAKEDAKFALVRIWVENKEYDKAFDMINQLIKTYPNKPFLLWFLGRAQLENQMYGGAIETHQKLLKVLTTSPYYHPAGEVECRYFLALAYYKNKDFQNSSVQIDSVLSFKKDSEKDKSIKDFIHQAEDLKKKIQKEMKSG